LIAKADILSFNTMRTEKEMLAGDLYDPLDAKLSAERLKPYTEGAHP